MHVVLVKNWGSRRVILSHVHLYVYIYHEFFYNICFTRKALYWLAKWINCLVFWTTGNLLGYFINDWTIYYCACTPALNYLFFLFWDSCVLFLERSNLKQIQRELLLPRDDLPVCCCDTTRSTKVNYSQYEVFEWYSIAYCSLILTVSSFYLFKVNY